MRRLLKIASASVLMLFLLPASLGAVQDAGTTQIVFPNGEIFYRQWMLPLNVQAQAVVKNFGDSAASFPVWLRMDTALVGISQVVNLLPQETALVQFPVTLPESGMHSITCSTALTGDVQPANDRIATWFETWESHLEVGPPPPPCTVQVGDPIVPMIPVRNRGTRAEGAMLLLTVSKLPDSMVVYQSAESVFVLPTQSALVTFDSWADSVGVYKFLLRIGRMPPPLLDTMSWLVTVVGVGVEEGDKPQASSLKPQATIVRGVLELPQATNHQLPATSWLLDAAGRRVAELHPGPNDVSRFPPGVYFVRSADSRQRSVVGGQGEVRKVVIAR